MRDPANFSLAEWQQAKRHGVDPRWIKAELQECWQQADNARALGQALQARGFTLARGDKRSVVVVGFDGAVQSLPRALGLKTKEVRARLGDGADLPSVAAAKDAIGQRMGPAMRRHIAESRERFQARAASLGQKKAAMTARHRTARADLDTRQRDAWQAEAGAQIEARYGRETARIWKKAVAHTLYRGLPDGETLKDIEHRSGKTSVMVRGFNVNQNQVNGSGDNLAEQARPLLQVEDIRAATGGEMGLLDARDLGFFTVAMPEFWERPEMSGLLRDVRTQPDKHASAYRALSASPQCAAPENNAR